MSDWKPAMRIIKVPTNICMDHIDRNVNNWDVSNLRFVNCVSNIPSIHCPEPIRVRETVHEEERIFRETGRSDYPPGMAPWEGGGDEIRGFS